MSLPTVPRQSNTARGQSFIAFLVTLGASLWMGAGVHAAGPGPMGENPYGVEDEAPRKRSPWRGSSLSYRNAATAITFDRSAELTYNPTWDMVLSLSPRYWLSDTLSLSANLDIQHELTESDYTTRANETLIGDVSLQLGAMNFARIPGIGVDMSGAISLGLPTSLASRGDTLLFALAPSLRLSRNFDVLSGLHIGYTLRFSKRFHEYTTAAYETPRISACSVGGSMSCDSFLSTGLLNTSFMVLNNFDVSLAFTDWVVFSTSFGIATSWIYDGIEDDRISNQPVESTDQRYAFIADLGLTFTPWRPLNIRAGASSIHPQLKPTDGYRAPYFNRYTAVYLDLRLDVVALVEALSEEN